MRTFLIHETRCLFMQSLKEQKYGKDGYFSVNYLEMVPLVIRSIQELKQELDELADAE